MRIDNISTLAGDIGSVPSSSLAQATISPVALNWNSYVGNPTGSGGGIIGGSSGASNPAAYISSNLGVRLAAYGIGLATGSVFFHLTGSNAFNFAKDFKVTSVIKYMGTVGNSSFADGYYIEVGQTGSIGSNTAPTPGTLSIKNQLFIGSTGSYVYVNGTNIAFDTTTFSSNFISELSSDWHTATLEVVNDKISGKRTCNFFINDTWLYGGADITSWNPSTIGGIVKVLGITGGLSVDLYCKSLKVEYI